MSFNWADHRFTQDAVPCTIQCRAEFQGRAAKPEVLALNGQTMSLQPLWLMDDQDPYPGEWALSAPDGCRNLLHMTGVS